MTQPIPVLINGSNGKMASALYAVFEDSHHFDHLGYLPTRNIDQASLTTQGGHAIGATIFSETVPTIIDFSHQESTLEVLKLALDVPCKLIIGTSGLGPEHMQLLDKVSKKRAIFRAINFSRGMHSLMKLLAIIGTDLGDAWQASVLDLHFTNKLDTPSGTAKVLAKTLIDNGLPDCEISTLRVGDGVCEHTALVAGVGERIEIAHKLLDRKAYMATVVDAVKFLETKEIGLFGMGDIYG